VRGHLETKADDTVIRSVEMVLTGGPQDLAEGRPFLLVCERVFAPNADGSFEVTGVFRGDYTLAIRLAGRSDWYADPLPPVSVDSQSDPSFVTVPLRKSSEVRGRVVDARTGRGIGDVSLVILGRQGSRYYRSVSSDADGKYRFYAPPGSMTISISSREAPLGYQLPGRPPVSFSVAENQPQVTVPDMKLEPAAQVEILVVDADGKPQPGAEIYRVAPLAMGVRAPESLRADDRGRALLRGLDPKDTLPLRVRTNEAVSDGMDVVDLGRQVGPVRVTVAKENAFSLTGIVCDDRGRPVPRATLALEWHRATVHAYSYTLFATYASDEDGRFSLPALWPGDSYRLLISAKGYNATKTGLIPGAAGKTHDFGSIVLRAIEGAGVP